MIANVRGETFVLRAFFGQNGSQVIKGYHTHFDNGSGEPLCGARDRNKPKSWLPERGEPTCPTCKRKQARSEKEVRG